MTAPTPVRSSCREYYGLHVVDVGEDGDMLVLGHGHPPRLALSALNAHARHLGFDLGDSFETARANLRESWAQLHTECCGRPVVDTEVPDGPCPGCDDDPAQEPRPREYAWCADWYAAADAPGAFPVTVWSA